MEINRLSNTPVGSTGREIYFSQSFRNEIEANLQYLITNANPARLTVTDAEAYMYRGDLLGLFNSKGVSEKHQWITLRMNGYLCASDFDGTQTTFIVPAEGIIASIERRFTALYTFDL